MPSTTATNLRRYGLLFPLAGAALALGASGAVAQPIKDGEPPLPQNAEPVAKLAASPKIALVSYELQLQAKGFGDIGVTPEQGDLVKFDASDSTDSDGDALTYDWDLDGNGTYELSQKGPKQSKRYYSTGTVNVKVRARDGQGGMNTDTEAIIVHAAPKPKISADLAAPLVGQSVNYSAAGSTGDPAIVKHEWDLDGDGTFEINTGLVGTASSSYPAPGPRTVKLKITDSFGVARTTSLITKVNQLPTAAFTNGPAVAGQPVQLDGSSSTDDSAIAAFAWDLDGDGSFETDTGATPTVSRTFATPGPATVRLRVTDDLGAISVVSRVIEIAAAPEAKKLGTEGAPAGAALPTLTKTKFKLAKNGRVKLRVSCPASRPSCKGTVKLRTKGKRPKTLATAKFTIAAGQAKTISLLLPAVHRKAIRRGSKLQLKAIIAVNGGGSSTKGILIGL